MSFSNIIKFLEDITTPIIVTGYVISSYMYFILYLKFLDLDEEKALVLTKLNILAEENRLLNAELIEISNFIYNDAVIAVVTCLLVTSVAIFFLYSPPLTASKGSPLNIKRALERIDLSAPKYYVYYKIACPYSMLPGDITGYAGTLKSLSSGLVIYKDAYKDIADIFIAVKINGRVEYLPLVVDLPNLVIKLTASVSEALRSI